VSLDLSGNVAIEREEQVFAWCSHKPETGGNHASEVPANGKSRRPDSNRGPFITSEAERPDRPNPTERFAR
jgi:hypothetical protein